MTFESHGGSLGRSNVVGGLFNSPDPPMLFLDVCMAVPAGEDEMTRKGAISPVQSGWSNGIGRSELEPSSPGVCFSERRSPAR